MTKTTKKLNDELDMKCFQGWQVSRLCCDVSCYFAPSWSTHHDATVGQFDQNGTIATHNTTKRSFPRYHLERTKRPANNWLFESTPKREECEGKGIVFHANNYFSIVPFCWVLSTFPLFFFKYILLLLLFLACFAILGKGGERGGWSKRPMNATIRLARYVTSQFDGIIDPGRTGREIVIVSLQFRWATDIERMNVGDLNSWWRGARDVTSSQVSRPDRYISFYP